MNNPQTLIAEAIAARGYADLWTPDQFLARQICKSTEELAELAASVGGLNFIDATWKYVLQRAGAYARNAFDDRTLWDNAQVDHDALAGELVDVLIPLLVAAEAMGIDALQMAVEKAQTDIARGVR